MKRIFQLSVATLLLAVGCTTDPIVPPGSIPVEPPIIDPGDAAPCDEGVISFQHQVLPIMVASCGYSGCHDRISAEDDVVLVDYESVRREVRPGDPNNSEVYESLFDDDDIMPPPPAAELTQAQKNTIRDWILQGANNTDCGAPCTPDQIAFQADIYPILQDYCVGCHGMNRQDGDVDLSSHANVIQYIPDGSLLGTMRHAVSFSPMPPSGSIISDCRIGQITSWIDAGAPNN